MRRKLRRCTSVCTLLELLYAVACILARSSAIPRPALVSVPCKTSYKLQTCNAHKRLYGGVAADAP